MMYPEATRSSDILDTDDNPHINKIYKITLVSSTDVYKTQAFFYD
jgi:hypothetical protein